MVVGSSIKQFRPDTPGDPAPDYDHHDWAGRRIKHVCVVVSVAVNTCEVLHVVILLSFPSFSPNLFFIPIIISSFYFSYSPPSHFPILLLFLCLLIFLLLLSLAFSFSFTLSSSFSFPYPSTLPLSSSPPPSPFPILLPFPPCSSLPTSMS
ncbi:hypothetical protein FHG87_002859 [Trinorchestia longiramus]|nr:hypothetical protein FHG87_002859 [Trinorchestia longiramus]